MEESTKPQSKAKPKALLLGPTGGVGGGIMLSNMRGIYR